MKWREKGRLKEKQREKKENKRGKEMQPLGQVINQVIIINLYVIFWNNMV